MKDILKYRTIKGLTQKELADELQLSRVLIATIETNDKVKVSEKTAKKISDFLGVDLYDISTLDDILKYNIENKEQAIKLINMIKEKYDV